MITQVKKDPQTVTTEGKIVQKLIDGVKVRKATTQMDHRGTLCEVYDARWGFTEEPITYIYQFVLRPEIVKAWIVHYKQMDRLFFSLGTAKLVLYDDREDSPTHQMVNKFHFGTEDRAMVTIPPHVFHGVKNVGNNDVLVMNLPTQPYLHDDPDKYRLPPDSYLIPYKW